MRDLREVRRAKLRAGVDELDAGGGIQMNGVGGMEVAEGRAFIGGVIDGLRYVAVHEEVNEITDTSVGRSLLQKSRRDEKERPKKGTMDTQAPRTMTMTRICYSVAHIRQQTAS